MPVMGYGLCNPLPVTRPLTLRRLRLSCPAFGTFLSALSGCAYHSTAVILEGYHEGRHICPF